MIAQGCVYKGKVRPVILEQLKTVTLKWQTCWVREHQLVISSLRAKCRLCQPYLRGWFWWAGERVHMEVLCGPHRDNVWWGRITFSSSLWIRTRHEQFPGIICLHFWIWNKFEPVFRILILSVCCEVCFAEHRWLLEAWSGCRAGKTVQPQEEGLSSEVCVVTRHCYFLRWHVSPTVSNSWVP